VRSSLIVITRVTISIRMLIAIAYSAIVIGSGIAFYIYIVSLRFF